MVGPEDGTMPWQLGFCLGYPGGLGLGFQHCLDLLDWESCKAGMACRTRSRSMSSREDGGIQLSGLVLAACSGFANYRAIGLS